MLTRHAIERFFARMLARWAPSRGAEPLLEKEAQTGANIAPPPGMYTVRKSTSVPDLLRRMRAHKSRVQMQTAWEGYKLDNNSPARVVTTVRCMLTTAEREDAVSVTVQCLKNASSTYIKIFHLRKCILHLDRKLLRFVENADRMTLAFNARSHEYDWWVLAFERRHLHDYHSLHYHVLQDASI